MFGTTKKFSKIICLFYFFILVNDIQECAFVHKFILFVSLTKLLSSNRFARPAARSLCPRQSPTDGVKRSDHAEQSGVFGKEFGSLTINYFFRQVRMKTFFLFIIKILKYKRIFFSGRRDTKTML